VPSELKRPEEVSMSADSPRETAFEEAVDQIPTCALDQQGVRAQRERFARLAPDVRRLDREAEGVVVEFHESFDLQTLQDALAIERACCPFFQFEFDDHEKRLRITVRDEARRPALDAMMHAFGGVREAGSTR
jgi:hypothetical protein